MDLRSLCTAISLLALGLSGGVVLVTGAQLIRFALRF
jgi:hypothetical protein